MKTGLRPMLARLALGCCLLLPFTSRFVFSQANPTTPLSALPAPASPPDGAGIFALRCAYCHGDVGQGQSGPETIAGPNIQAEHKEGDVMMAMEVGPSHMPRFAKILSVQEMRAVADYVTHKLAVIPLSGGNVSEGGALYRIYCATCHRTVVRGGALVFTMNAPNLLPKSPALIAGAIRWGPGPMPKFPPSVLSDEQVASIVRYVEYTKQPPSPGGSALHWNGPVSEGFVAWVIVFSLIFITLWIEKGGKG